jgi:hypothetical protein
VQKSKLKKRRKRVELPDEVGRHRIVSLKQAAAILGVSVDTLRRRHHHLIVQISDRRQGMWLDQLDNIGVPNAA